MASKTVSQLSIELGVKGGAQLEKLKSAFRGLEKASSLSDKEITKVRQAINDFAKDTNRSVQSIEGQIEAFKGLQRQARVGSQVYKTLGTDIKNLAKELDALGTAYEETTKKARSLSQQESTFAAKAGTKINNQFAARRKLLAELKVDSQEYLNVLSRQTIQEEAYTAAMARQRVIAAAAQATKLNLPGKGSKEYTKEQIREYYMGGLGDLPNTTAALSLRLQELRQDFANLDIGGEGYLGTLRQINELQKQVARTARIAEIESRDTALMGRQDDLEAFLLRGRGRRSRAAQRGAAAAEQEAAAARRAAATLPPREISGLYRQIGDIGMSGIRADIELMGNSYRQVERDIKAAANASNGSIRSFEGQRNVLVALRREVPLGSREFRKYTRQIEQLDKRLNKLNRTSRFSGRALAQIGGAAISGGIFGGPLGFLGGVAGGVIGGPGGAFAGAAAGAQANMLVEQAAGMARYSAELSLAKKTLAQVATGQEEFNVLLDKARQISTDYSVDFKETIKGYAQVAVAAKANNLTLEQTESIYRGLIAAGTAFGKTQEDLDALIRATVQVLSKGKVSAEEMSGQIGERLPGAVAKFAAANGKSLAQLADDFKKGKVTIADFVVFAESQFEEYDGLAQAIAQGPEKAGMRLDIALKRAQETYGAFFGRVGASFQSNLADVVNWVNGNDKQIKNLLTKFYNFAKGIKQWVIDNKQQLKNLYNGFVTFASDLVSLFEVLARELAKVMGPFFKFLAENIARGVKGLRQIAEMSSTPRNIEMEAKKYVDDVMPGLDPRGKAQEFENAKRALTQYYANLKKKPELKASDLFKPLDPTIFGSSGITPPGSGLAEDTDTEKSKDISKSQADMLVRIANLRRQGLTVQADILEFERALLATKEEADKPEKARVDRAKALQTFTQQIASAVKGMGTDYMKISKELDAQDKLNKQFNFDLKERQYQLGLISEKEYNTMLIEQERARLKDQYPDMDPAQREEMVALKQQEIDPTPFQEMRQNIAQLKQELTDLLNPVNQITGAANAIGTAFSTSFINVINGSQTAREALASFFRNVGKYFLDMASQIIAKMITMAILNQVVGLLPGGAPMSSKGYFDPMTGKGVAGPNYGLAKGGIVDRGIVKRYAMGGIVDKPTMFAYANGGTGRFGLMGEAGPEAILPLKRGSDGKLGVASTKSVGNIVVNVDATGSSAAGDEPDSKRLGEAIGAAVRQELMRQQRPGGILA